MMELQRVISYAPTQETDPPCKIGKYYSQKVASFLPYCMREWCIARCLYIDSIDLINMDVQCAVGVGNR